MADVTLVLRADNSQYVSKMREAQQASQKVYDTVERGMKREKGLIEDIEGELTRLQNARRKANSVEEIEKYNRKIKEAQRDLKEYEDTGVKANENIAKSSDKLGTTITNLAKKYGLIGSAIALVTKVGRDLITTFKDTVLGLNLVTSAGEVYRQTLYNIIQGTNDWTASNAKALAIAKMANDLRKKERENLVEIAKLRIDYNKLYFESSDRTQDDNERLQKINEAMAVHNKMIDLETENIRDNLVVVLMQLSNRPKSNKLLDEAAKLEAALAEAEGKRYSEVKRLESQRSMLEEEIWQKKKQRYFDEIDANNKLLDEKIERQKKFQDLSLKLIDEYDKANIESLEGEDKLAAQRDYELKAVEAFKTEMQKLGTLTAEQENMFRELGGKVWMNFYKGLYDYQNETGDLFDKFLEQNSKDMVEFTRDQKKQEAEVYDDYMKWLFDNIDKEIAKREELKEKIFELSQDLIGNIGNIYAKRAEDARLTRELYDTQIEELQASIDKEIQLHRAGYVANVNLKQKELDTLKQKRDQAIRDEQKALDRERAIELAIQSVNLATSITSLFKEEIKSKGVYGLITGAVAAGAFLLLWNQYKNEAQNATKLAHGGSGTDTGMITGRSHAAGGERFTDHIEVERGEAWGVLSVPATQKYGKIFHEMVSSFNRGEIPAIDAPVVNNRVYVQNDGPNSRLERLIGEQRKLNERLSNIESVHDTGKFRIVQRGSNTRIIQR